MDSKVPAVLASWIRVYLPEGTRFVSPHVEVFLILSALRSIGGMGSMTDPTGLFKCGIRQGREACELYLASYRISLRLLPF